jgi:hypothetical protein
MRPDGFRQKPSTSPSSAIGPPSSSPPESRPSWDNLLESPWAEAPSFFSDFPWRLSVALRARSPAGDLNEFYHRRRTGSCVSTEPRGLGLAALPRGPFLFLHFSPIQILYASSTLGELRAHQTRVLLQESGRAPPTVASSRDTEYTGQTTVARHRGWRAI